MISWSRQRLTSLACAAVAFVSPGRAAERLWLRQLEVGAGDSSIVHADVAEQPGPELVFTTTSGDVAVWDAAGREIYLVHLGGVFSIPPTAADLFPGGPLEVLVVDQAGRVSCLARDQVLWQYALGAAMEWNSTTLVAEDLDGDGTVEIVGGPPAGPLVCLGPEASRSGGAPCRPACARRSRRRPAR